MSDGEATLLTAAGTISGVVPSWFLSRKYLLKSGAHLEDALRPLAGDRRRLLQITNSLARVLQQAGIGLPVFDAAGDLVGIAIKGSDRAAGASDSPRSSAASTPPATR
jgi:hypothetical protein